MKREIRVTKDGVTKTVDASLEKEYVANGWKVLTYTKPITNNPYTNTTYNTYTSKNNNK